MSDTALLTIVSVNYNSSDFIGLMLYSFKRLTVNPYRVLIVDNGSSIIELLKLIQIARQYDNIEILFREQTSAGSAGHGQALDIICAKVTTPYFVVMDADAVFLQKRWDETLIECISDQVKCIGTSLPVTFGNKKHNDFPQIYSVLYETKTFKELKCSFMPDTENPGTFRDTGYQIRERFLAAGYTGLIFEARSTREYTQGPLGHVICVEYYHGSGLISSHFGRGSAHAWCKYASKYSLLAGSIAKLFLVLRASAEKRQWINACHSIINGL